MSYGSTEVVQNVLEKVNLQGYMEGLDAKYNEGDVKEVK